MEKKKITGRGKKPSKSKTKKTKKSKAGMTLAVAKKKMESLQAELDQLKNGDGKFNLVPTCLTEKQMHSILSSTPDHLIHTRKIRGGGTCEYVTGNTVAKKLNYTFGWLWDTELISKDIITNQEGLPIHIAVIIKMTVKMFNKKTNEIVAIGSKTQAGGHDVQYKNYNGNKQYKFSAMINFSDDLKSAITDAEKKCASKFGFFSDIYGKNEFKNVIKQVVEDESAPPEKDVTAEAKVQDLIDFQINEEIKKLHNKINFNRKNLENMADKLFKKSPDDLTEREKETLLAELKKMSKSAGSK